MGGGDVSPITGQGHYIYSHSGLCYNLLTYVTLTAWWNDVKKEDYNLEKEEKSDIISKFGLHKEDTGSTEVQVTLLTGRINRLTKHMLDNRHDYHTQRGLLKLVGQRRRLLAYLSKEDMGRYNKLITRLGLRK